MFCIAKSFCTVIINSAKHTHALLPAPRDSQYGKREGDLTEKTTQEKFEFSTTALTRGKKVCVLVACGQSQQEASLRVITHATDTRGLPYERSRDACRLRNATTFSYQSIF